MTEEFFTQEAKGKATLQIVPGSAHCSITEPTIKIRYKISAELAYGILDKDKFTANSLLFEKYIRQLEETPISISCEMLAKKIAIDFANFFPADKKQFISRNLRNNFAV